MSMEFFEESLDERLERLLYEEEKVLRQINRLLLKEKRLLNKSNVRNRCDKIRWMDGAIHFWLYVIEMARRDFIAYYNHPSKWDIETPIGKIWVSAYAFIFRDDYKISFNVKECPYCNDKPEEYKCKECFGTKLIKSPEGTKFSFKDILDMCKDACPSRRINISIQNPSLEKMRANLVEKIQDDWLSEKAKKGFQVETCQQEENSISEN